MKDTENLNNLIEKIIKLRINDVIEKSNLDEKTTNEIRNINKKIAKDNKRFKNRKKSQVDKKDKKLNPYTTYIKDTNNIIKDNPTLNYLPNNLITQIKKLKEKKNTERLEELSKLWKTIDNTTINKYKDLTKDKKFTNEKYNEIVDKVQTPKIARKKKSKE